MNVKSLFLAIALLVLLVRPVSADGPINYPGFQPKNAETEYYRGIYDACRWAMWRMRTPAAEAITQCRAFVGQAQNSNWYDQPSGGWTADRLPPAWGSGI